MLFWEICARKRRNCASNKETLTRRVVSLWIICVKFLWEWCSKVVKTDFKFHAIKLCWSECLQCSRTDWYTYISVTTIVLFVYTRWNILVLQNCMVDEKFYQHLPISNALSLLLISWHITEDLQEETITRSQNHPFHPNISNSINSVLIRVKNMT